MPRVKMTVWKDAMYECELDITDDEAVELETNGDVFNPTELLQKYHPTLVLTEDGDPDVTSVRDYETDKEIWDK